jgi:hypothetical protein
VYHILCDVATAAKRNAVCIPSKLRIYVNSLASLLSISENVFQVGLIFAARE